jgi:hypothetical protein
MLHLPIYINVLFVFTVIVAIIAGYWMTRSKTFLIITVCWTLLQSAIGMSGFYHYTQSVPPRLLLFGVFPTLLAIAATFLTSRGQQLLDSMHLQRLTLFHTIRIPVELVLVMLYHNGLVSEYMTWEGTNFDLFSGVSAPVIGFLAFKNVSYNKKLLGWWNVICLMLLLNVVITAVFALPSPFQKLSFNQPNVAVLYAPYNLLPTVVVPLVLLAHLAAFRQLYFKRTP